MMEEEKIIGFRKKEQKIEQNPKKAKEENYLTFFKSKEDGLDYKNINLFIKLVGGLIVVALILLILQWVGVTIFAPISKLLALLSPFILGIVFAWLLTPITNILVSKKWKAHTASLLVTVVSLTLLTVLFAGFFYVTVDSVSKFATGGQNLNYFLTTGENLNVAVTSYLNSGVPKSGMYNFVVQFGVFTEFVEEVESSGLGQPAVYQFAFQGPESMSGIISTIFSYGYKIIIAAVVVGFMLPNFSNFGNTVKSIIPKRVREESDKLLDLVGVSFSQYMRGTLMIGSIVGCVIAVGIGIVAILSSTIFYQQGAGSILYIGSGGFRVLGTILIFGILAGLTNLIPYAGPFIGGIPIVIIVALNDNSQNYWVTISVVLIIILTQSLESLFLQPYIMGKKTRLHPVLILLGLTLFASLFGIIGLIISTPILSVIRSVVLYYNDKYKIF